jgi:hypothetical protein
MSNVIKMMGLIIVLLCMSLFSFFIDFNNYQNINYQNINYTTSRSFNNKKNIDSIIKTDRFDELVKKNEFQKIENELKKINSIKNIEIYHNSNLELEIDIVDRDPVAVLLELNSYMDSSGVIIWTNNLVIDSLVQIIGTIDKSKIPKILKTIKAFNDDNFFYNKLESMSFRDGEIYLKIRNYDLDIRIGNEYQLKNKLKMLKGFYAYQSNKIISKEYKQIDLVYNNRLIAIKK